MVYVHADQLLADGLDEQSGNDRRVHAARKSQQNLLVANLAADEIYLRINKGICQRRGGDALHLSGAHVRGVVDHA